MDIKKIMAYAIIMLMSTATVAAVDKLPPLSSLFIPMDKSLDDGGKSHLPKTIFSTGGAIIDQNTMQLSIEGSGEADLDFINTLTHGAIEVRTKLLPMDKRIYEVAGNKCSVNPDYSAMIVTTITQTQICYFNENKPGAILRLWDVEGELEYIGEKQILKGFSECFIVESDHHYLYDIMNCASQACNCGIFRNQYCQKENNTITMTRVRDCSPDNCDTEQTTVNWVDLSTQGCEQVKAYCHETDGGKDYSHYGRTITPKETKQDVCVSESKLKEYYCKENEITSTYHYCLPNQKCIQGECITTDTVKDCDIVDGKLRLNNYEWCLGITKKTCNNGKIELEFGHPDCETPSCDYNGILLNLNENICMSDGVTIATCRDSINTERAFTYSECTSGTECVPNAKYASCQKITEENIEDNIPKTRTIWDWLSSLFGGSK